MATKKSKTNQSGKRENQVWIDELSGKCGEEAQWLSHEDLGRYLYTIALADLIKRQRNIPMLQELTSWELGEHAQDFVQSVLEKLARNNFAVLEQYTGAGKFTSWAAQIMHRQISTELRKVHWHRTSFFESMTSGEWLQADLLSPEASLLQTDLRERLNDCMNNLPERMLIVFVRCEVEGERPRAVAESLGVTTNAVYLLIHRAKINLRSQLLADGYGL